MRSLKEYFSIGEAAKAAHTTSETLRHYDRIGLVKPSKTDEWTKYRYYTRQDILRLNTVRALQQMDLPLREIKQVLEYDDLGKIVDYLSQAAERADEKIAALEYSKSRILLVKAEYEKKLQEKREPGEAWLQEFPARVILLSDTLEAPTLDNLWNYLSHFYDKIDPALRDAFAFEDMAGIYTEDGVSRLFAVCIRYADVEGLKTVPAGTYLCADCTEENREAVLENLLRMAEEQHGAEPPFTIQQIVVSGILQWTYQIQLLIKEA